MAMLSREATTSVYSGHRDYFCRISNAAKKTFALDSREIRRVLSLAELARRAGVDSGEGGATDDESFRNSTAIS
jgi:hypothetical protein